MKRLNLKVFIFRGLPASGKSTEAKRICEENENYMRINKDDLREMLCIKYNREVEGLVIHTRNSILKKGMAISKNIIIDDTNLNPTHVEEISNIVAYHNKKSTSNRYDIVIDDTFLKVDMRECIERDSKREKSVGEKVISNMYNKYIVTKKYSTFDERVRNLNNLIPSLEKEVSKKDCYVFDIDGTLTVAQENTRIAYDWSRVGEDKPNENVFRILNDIPENYDILIVSGRDDVCMPDTLEWLKKHTSKDIRLHMRKNKDSRKDSIVKKEIYEEHIKPYYNVVAVYDDRQQVVDMWRNQGICTLQVEENLF